MLTKFYLTVNGTRFELGEDQVKNWDAVKCSWRRSDFSGMVRTFTSKFEFVGRARDLLRAEYQANETEASASIALYAIGDDWQYREVFACPLDFSTYQENGKCIMLSAIDNSIASRIKANKSTKYEYEIGTDIEADGNYFFKRIELDQNVTYAITYGDSQDDGSMLIEGYKYGEESKETIFFGVVGEEITLTNDVLYNDDDAPSSHSHTLEVYNNKRITLSYSFEYERILDALPDKYMTNACDLLCEVRKEGNEGNVSEHVLHKFRSVLCVGEFNSASEVIGTKVYDGTRGGYPPAARWIEQHIPLIAIIGGIVHELSVEYVSGDLNCTGTKSTGQTREEYNHYKAEGTYTIEAQAGCGVSLSFAKNVKLDYPGYDYKLKAHFDHFIVLSSSIRFEWKSIGNPVSIQSISPKIVLDAVLGKMLAGLNGIETNISGHDGRLAYTRLLAAESVRDIPNAKLYTSFNEFCEWMEAVFGYTYYIDGNKITSNPQPPS